MRLNRWDAAQRELLGLLEVRGEHLDVLRQLAEVSQAMRNWEAAAGYQERVVALDPSRGNLERLARYYTQKKDPQSAARVWKRMLLEATDDSVAAAVIDRQLQDGNLAEALALCELHLARDPSSWKVLLRVACAQLAIGKPDQALPWFEKLLELPDEPIRARPSPRPTSRIRSAGPAMATASVPAGAASFVRLPDNQHQPRRVAGAASLRRRVCRSPGDFGGTRHAGTTGVVAELQAAHRRGIAIQLRGEAGGDVLHGDPERIPAGCAFVSTAVGQ